MSDHRERLKSLKTLVGRRRRRRRCRYAGRKGVQRKPVLSGGERKTNAAKKQKPRHRNRPSIGGEHAFGSWEKRWRAVFITVFFSPPPSCKEVTPRVVPGSPRQTSFRQPPRCSQRPFLPPPPFLHLGHPRDNNNNNNTIFKTRG